MRRAVAAGLAGAALVAGLSGCAGTGPAAPADPLPPRPQEVRMDGLDPCALVPAAVLAQAGMPNKPKVIPAGALGIRHCSWERDVLQRPGGALDVATATQQDVRNVLSVPGAQITSVAGFGAVSIPLSEYGDDTNCGVRVDVAAGQGLWVGYNNLLGDEPGATHALMCERAQRAAEGIMQRLLATAN